MCGQTSQMRGGQLGIEAGVVAIAAALGVTTTAVYIAIGQFVLLVASSVYASNKAKQGSPDISARTLTSRGTIDPAKIIYGEALVAGTLAYRNAHGIRNREMWAVHVLAGHEIEGITDVYLDDKLITNAQINSGAAAGGAVGSGDFGPVRSQTVCAIYKHYGTSTQTSNSALVAASSDWSTSHRLRGYAYAVTEFVLWDRTQTLWEAGDPTNVKFLVQGKKVYDPRLDSTQTFGSGSHRVATPATWEYSDCPPLCLADYLMDSKFSPLANGISPDRIDWEAVADAADICDTLVFIPPAASPQNTEKRYTCNGVIYGADTPEENVKRLLSSFNGTLAFTSGMYVIDASTYEAPADSLSEDDVIGAIAISSALDSDERVNTLKAIYTDRDKQYEATETAAIELYKTERDNGEELIKSIELPLTNSWFMAQRICLLRLQEANEELTVTVPCNLKAARLVPGQRVNFTLTERGWTPKVFKVLSWEFFDRGGDKLGVNLKLREDDATAYGDPEVADYNTVDAFGTLTIVDPDPVPGLATIPLGINVSEGAWNINLVNNSTNGTVDSDVGEVWLTAGTFALPDGTARVFASGYVATPYEVANTPPDQVAYIVWGATNPDTRFGAVVWGSANAETAGLFCAIYDRNADQWYAVDNAGAETAFTPADTDYVVARLVKTSASGGIDGVTSLVAFVNDPLATVGATLGTDVFNEAGDILSDIDVRNDQLVTSSLGLLNANPTFQIPRVRNSGPTTGLGNLVPASWFLSGTATQGHRYVDDAVRDEIIFDAATGALVTSEARRVEVGTTYEFVALCRATASTMDVVLSAREYSTDQLPTGKRSIGSATSPEDEVTTATTSVTVATANVGTSYTLVSGFYTPTGTAKWFSMGIIEDTSPGSGQDMYVEWAGYREASTRNTGALADQDTVDWQTDISGTGIPDDSATQNTVTSGTATPTGGSSGDLYYETDADAWWANISSVWVLVADETANNIAASIAGQGNLATLDVVTAGTNFVTSYTAGASILLASTASLSNSTTTYTQLSDSFQLEGGGDVRIYFDAYSDADVTNPDLPIQIQFRQGASVLATFNRYGIGTWVSGLLVDVTLVSSTVAIDVWVRRQEAATTGGVRNVEIGIGAMANGEAIV